MVDDGAVRGDEPRLSVTTEQRPIAALSIRATWTKWRFIK